MVSKIIANTRKHGHLTRVETLLSSILVAVVYSDAFEDPKFLLLPKNIGVLAVSSVAFKCSIINPGAINSTLDTTIKWCKNGYPVRSGIIPGNPSGLFVDNIQPTDEYGCGIDGFLCKETTKLHFVRSTTATTTTAATDAFEDPKFLLLPKNIGVLAGSSVAFKCSIINPGAINSTLDTTIKWCKNGYPVRSGIIPGNPSGLFVDNIQPTDEYGCGIDGFLCKETTKLHFVRSTTATTTTAATDAFEDPKFLLLPKNIGVLAGSSVAFKCSIINPGAINSTLDTTIKWCKNGYPVRSGIIPGNPSGLFVDNIQPTDEYGCGIDGFLCKETTKLHFVRSTTATTTTAATDAFEDPKFQLLPKNIGVLAGSSVAFKCSIINPGAINSTLDTTIKWCKNGYPVRSGITPGNPSGLTVVNIWPTDEYGCGIDGFLCKETTKLHLVTALSIKTLTTVTTTTSTTALPSRVTVDKSSSNSPAYVFEERDGVEVVSGTTLPCSSAVIALPVYLAFQGCIDPYSCIRAVELVFIRK